MFDEELDMTEEENKKEFNQDAMMLQGMIANMIWRKLPEDYWEKEGTGWK